mgnify:CR=1 FL=1|jgi:hypothetical protein
MKKLVFLFIVVLMTACSSKELTTYNGCKYEIKTNIFSDTTEVVIMSSDFKGTDISRIVLSTTIDAKEVSPLVIKLPRTTMHKGNEKSKFVLSIDNANHIRENCSKMYKNEDILSIMKKDSKYLKDFKVV